MGSIPITRFFRGMLGRNDGGGFSVECERRAGKPPKSNVEERITCIFVGFQKHSWVGSSTFG